MTITHTRRSFGQLVRRARRAGTLTRYDRHVYGYSRVATFADGICAIWHHPSYYGVAVDDRDEDYERAAARYAGSGRDWR